MAVKGIGKIDGFSWEGATTFGAHADFISLDSIEVYDDVTVTGATPLTIYNDVKAAIKDKLINVHGVEVGILDTILIMNGSV